VRAAQAVRQREHDALERALELGHAFRAERAQLVDHLAHEHLGRRRAGGDADAALALDPLGIELGRRVDHVRGHAAVRGDLAQPVRVRAVRAADDDHDVDRGREHLDRVLAVLRRVADVVLPRPDDRREAALERLDDARGVVDRKCGLRDVRESLGIGDDQPRDVGDRLDQVHAAVELPGRALDLGCPRWPIITMSRPCSCIFAISTCTFVTSGQVASNTVSPRALASARTALLTPCAENTTVAPRGTSSSSSMNTAPLRLRSSTTVRLCTTSWRT
jgi:hypothetical protein